MTRRIFARLALLLTALAVFPSFVAAEDSEQARIVAVGDLHGDFDHWMAIAVAAGLTDGRGNWSGGETVLVQLGDITDRGPDSLRIIRHLQQLEGEAKKAGGEVIVLLGNHEAMNVLGDLRYVHPGEYEAFRDKRSKRRRDATWKANRELLETTYAAMDPPLDAEAAKAHWYEQTPLGMLEHRRAWMPGGELGEWAASLPAVVKLGGTLFVHGGLSVERALEPLDLLNARISAALAPGEAIDRSALEDPLGPLWYRGNVARGEADAERVALADELAQVLAFHNAARLVVAHTPSIKGIVSSEGGKLIRVDTGISSHYGGPLSFLEIIGDQVIAHERMPDGSWSSRIIPACNEEQVR